jgi:pimeloyl-ACP methyl ester carboxylesterase
MRRIHYLAPALIALAQPSCEGTGGQSGATRLTAFRDRLHRDGALRDLAVDGYRYAVADLGRGPPLVLLHGLGGSIYDWRGLLGPLAMGHRVIAIDLLGAGESDKPAAGDYSLPAQARRVKGLLDALRIPRAAVIGNSYGGGVALALAEDWPERVDRLVLINPVCYADRVPFYVTLCRIPIADQVVQVLPLRLMARWVLRASYRDPEKLSEEELDTYVAELRPAARRSSVIRTVRDLIPPDPSEFYERMKAIEAPTLILWGKDDHTLPVEQGRRLAGELPYAKLIELDAGHVPNQETPEVVLKYLSDFLRQE